MIISKIYIDVYFVYLIGGHSQVAMLRAVADGESQLNAAAVVSKYREK